MNEYSERLALGARARQYDRMRMLFERASELLPEVLESRNAVLTRAIYLELARRRCARAPNGCRPITKGPFTRRSDEALPQRSGELLLARSRLKLS
jgi:hypothetical protein